MNAIIPIPKIDIVIRSGTMDDLPFLDSLQKLHTKQVGWMPTAQFEGKIKLGHVLIAESAECSVLSAEPGPTQNSALRGNPGERVQHCAPVGYCIGNDQYFKRDDVGIIYQMNVVPTKQRGLIGASLLKAQFERSAYGCRLYCCWCAQDIDANHFWESMGFVPLAFRAGSRAKGAGGKSRVHIFWQKRIRAGDTTTPWWFPSQTTSGAIREDRLVLPIPPGVHWSDAKPIVLPGAQEQQDKPKMLPGRGGKTPTLRQPTQRRVQFGKPVAASSVSPDQVKPSKRAPAKRQKQKNDPKLIAAARELRDRYLEEVNSGRVLLDGAGKYDVSRALDRTRGQIAAEVTRPDTRPDACPVLPAPLAA